MNLKRYLLYFALVSAAVLSYGENNTVEYNEGTETTNYTIDVLESTKNKLVIEFRLSHFNMEQMGIDDSPYLRISLPDCGVTQEIGSPEFPVVNRLIAIPESSRCTFRVLEEEWQDITLSKYPFPHQKPLLEEEADFSLAINDTIYGSFSLYEPTPYSLVGEGCWRNQKNTTMSICPFKFNFSDYTLSYLSHLKLAIEFASSSPSVSDDSSWREEKTEEMANALYINSNIVKAYKPKSSSKAKEENDYDYKYLIISPDEFIHTESMRAFIDWKSRMGYVCKIVPLSEVGTTSASIKNYIYNEYNNYGIWYVLLVGNESYIPQELKLVALRDVYGDYWYGCLDGDNDNRPEVQVGRFCISNETELKNMIYKTINYEKNPTNGIWLKTSLLIAHQEYAPGKYQACKDSVRTYSYQAETPIFLKAYGASTEVGGTNATNDTIVNAINNGIGLINYRGHGDTCCWHRAWNLLNEPFDTLSVDELTNVEKHPVVFSIACLTGCINSAEKTLSEAFSSGKNGSVAFLGATVSSYTSVNHTYDKSIYKSIFDNKIFNIGSISTAASISTFTTCGINYYSKYNIFSYWWNGDPSLEIHTDSLAQQIGIDYWNTSDGLYVNLGSDTEREVVVSSALDDGKSYCEIIANPTTNLIHFPGIQFPFYITVKKHNHFPLLSNTYVQNVAINDSVYLSGDNIFIGTSVTPNLQTGNVSVGSNGDVLICPSKRLRIEGKSEAGLGSRMKTVKTKL